MNGLHADEPRRKIRAVFRAVAIALIITTIISSVHGWIQGATLSPIRQMSQIISILICLWAAMVSAFEFKSIYAVVCSLLAVFIFFASFLMFDVMRQLRFFVQRSQFSAIVMPLQQQVRDAAGVSSFIPKPSSLPFKRVVVLGEKDNLVLEIHTGGAFPNKHFGYAYLTTNSEVSLNKLQARYNTVRGLADNWFLFSD